MSCTGLGLLRQDARLQGFSGMDSQDLGHDRPDKASKVKDDANGQRSQGHRETREVDRTTVGQNYYSLSGTDQTSCGGTPAGDDVQSLVFWCVCTMSTIHT